MITKCKALTGTVTPVRRYEETDMDMLTVAKRIVEEGPQDYASVSKAMLYREMAKRADATRRSDETKESAFARFATTDADGRALFAAYKVAGGEDYEPAPSADPALLGPRPEERPVPPPNAAHDQLMRKAEALVAEVEKSGVGETLTIERAFEKVLTDPANRTLAQAALRPAFMKGAPPIDEDDDEDDGESQASYEDDGGNAAQNARSAVIGRLSSDKDKTGRPASATRTFGLSGRKAKVAARVQKFLTMCPKASDDDALGYALSRKSVRKALEAKLRVG
jgi:hypothetical protein